MDIKTKKSKKTKEIIFIIALFIFFLAIIIIGYRQYFRLLPSLVGASNFSLYIILIFGFLAGVLSFFAPCSIALLPSYMGFFLGLKEKRHSNTMKNSLKVGSITTLGMLSFYAVLGSIFLLFAKINTVAYFVRILVPIMAIILLILGVSFVSRKSFNLRFLSKASSSVVSSKKRTNRNMFLFGIGYAAGSIACFLPIFILLIVTPFLLGNIGLGFFAFLAFAVGKGLLMIFTTILIGFNKEKILYKMSVSTSLIQKVSGVIIILVGIYLAYLSLVLFRIIPMLKLGGF